MFKFTREYLLQDTCKIAGATFALLLAQGLGSDAMHAQSAIENQQLADIQPRLDSPGLREVGTGAGVADENNVRVVVRSFELAAISAEINSRIIYLPGREGDRFHKGDVLIKFDCTKADAEYESALAVLGAHKAAHENQVRMLAYKAAGTLAVEQAGFEMAKAVADVKMLEAKRSGCVVLAPFDGRVAEKIAQVHEVTQPNQAVLRIMNENKLELVLMVPSAWLSRISDGTRFQVKFDETGESHAARIVQSTGLIDPVSQSARFIAELEMPSSHVSPGMSGTAEFFRKDAAR